MKNWAWKRWFRSIPIFLSQSWRDKLNRTPYIIGAHVHARSRTCTRTRGKWLTRERSGEQCCTIHASTRLVLFRGSHWITLSIKVILPLSLLLFFLPSLSIFPWAFFLYTAFSDTIEGFFFYSGVPLEPTMTGLRFLRYLAAWHLLQPLLLSIRSAIIDFLPLPLLADVDPYWDSSLLPALLCFFKFLSVLR